VIESGIKEAGFMQVVFSYLLKTNGMYKPILSRQPFRHCSQFIFIGPILFSATVLK